MQRICGFVRALAVVGAVVWSSAASAGIISLDFPQDVTVGGGSNASAEGFRISPTAEYTLVTPGSGGFISSGLAWDSDGPANAAYLGGSNTVSHSSLFIDHAGATFNLQSVTFVSSGFDSGFEMKSSKGGTYFVPHGAGILDVDFSGAQWTDISWLVFGYFDAGLPTVGLQQLVVNAVDEPAMLVTLALGFAMLLGFRRVTRRV